MEDVHKMYLILEIFRVLPNYLTGEGVILAHFTGQ